MPLLRWGLSLKMILKNAKKTKRYALNAEYSARYQKMLDEANKQTEEHERKLAENKSQEEIEKKMRELELKRRYL